MIVPMRHILLVCALLLSTAAAADEWAPVGQMHVRTDAQAAPIVDEKGVANLSPVQTWFWIDAPDGAAAVLVRGRLNTSRQISSLSVWQVLDFCNKPDTVECADNTTDTPTSHKTRFTAWKVITAGGTNGARGDETMILKTVNHPVTGKPGFWWRWNKVQWQNNNPSSASTILWIDAWWGAP